MKTFGKVLLGTTAALVIGVVASRDYLKLHAPGARAGGGAAGPAPAQHHPHHGR